MKFPGKRKSKHYFPVAEQGRLPFETDFAQKDGTYIVGIDQLIVDIEVQVDDEFLSKYSITKGESVLLSDTQIEEIYSELKSCGRIIGEYAGGAIGNTLHNFSVLADAQSVALGTICKDIAVGDYAFKYICNTSSKVDFSYLKPSDGAMGRAICFITPDNERSFGIGKGIMNQLSKDYIPEDVIKGSAGLLISAYLFRDENAPMFDAAMTAASMAKEYGVPVVMAMGTSSLVEEKRDFLKKFIEEHVTVIALNQKEAQALVGEEDPLLAGEKILELTDLALLTVGSSGLYVCGHVEKELARKTGDQIHSKSIAQYNKFEYSRAMRKRDCQEPLKIYTHINPFLGGPGVIKNTNGAGDAALAAVLHDIAANAYHKNIQPSSPKHMAKFLTYSSLHQVSKYANRASFEVLRQNSPRLFKALPSHEDCLEQGYWDR